MFLAPTDDVVMRGSIAAACASTPDLCKVLFMIFPFQNNWRRTQGHQYPPPITAAGLRLLAWIQPHADSYYPKIIYKTLSPTARAAKAIAEHACSTGVSRLIERLVDSVVWAILNATSLASSEASVVCLMRLMMTSTPDPVPCTYVRRDPLHGPSAPAAPSQPRCDAS